MRIEELAEWTPEKLEALTDQQLLEICKQYFNVTRPEMVEKKPKAIEQPQQYLSPNKRAALEMLQEAGVDVSFMNRRKKR